jgi:HAMP domain-containing protein
MSLNESQQRAVAVALRQLEDRLGRIEDIVHHDESGVLFHRPRPRWSSEEVERIGAIVTELRAAIASVAETCRLPSEERDPGREIAGLMRVSWESLAEIDSNRLRSYGRVDPGLRASLDPTLERMMALVATVEDLAVGHGAEDEPQSV